MWHTPQITAYTNEAELQDLVVETPSLLPGVEQGWALAGKEMPISGAGSADVVIVDGNGDITVVECKLRANPEIRRQVVGQLLAYASAIWGMSFAEFDDAFRRSEAKRSLSDALVSGTELNEEEFRRAVEDNLTSGSMRLIIAVDEITDELKRIVSYLNSHTTRSVELLAFEMRRAVDEGVEVLLPETYGEESADAGGTGGGPRGNLSFRELEELAAQAGVDELYEYAVTAFEGVLRKGTTKSSIGFAGPFGGSRKTVISLLPRESNPRDGLRYQLYKNRFAELAKASDVDLETLIPQSREHWHYWPAGGPDWEGFRGFIKDREEIDRLAGALRGPF